MSVTDGSGTRIGWNRRSRAASFSMSLRYSSIVVAPMTCSSPRARAGLSMFAASIEPSPAPAPTTVCSSSMKMISSSPCARISSMTFFSRSSKSPRYLVPATMPPRSIWTRRLSRSVSGTSPSTIRCAMPSTIAVLPTPGSPMSTGLFFVRLDSTSIVCSISCSRPTTGSTRPSRASAVRSVPNWSTVGVSDGGFLPALPAPAPRPPPPVTASCSASGVIRASLSTWPAADSGLTASANSRCSGPMYDEPKAREICRASSSARLAAGVRLGISSRGWPCSAWDSICLAMASGSAPAALSRRRTGSCLVAAHSRWSVSRSGSPHRAAWVAASLITSRPCSVSSWPMSIRWAGRCGRAPPKKRAKMSSKGLAPKSPDPMGS